MVARGAGQVEAVSLPLERATVDLESGVGLDSVVGLIRRTGFDVAVATNQSGIGRKLLDEPALELIHQKMRSAART